MTSEEKFYVAKFMRVYQNDFDSWIVSEYENDGKDPNDAITAFQVEEDLDQEAHDMMMNEPVNLTFGQLMEMLDDIVLKNISFDDSGIHISDVEELIESYGD